MKTNKQLVNRLVQQAIQALLPMQIAAGVTSHQRVRNSVALHEIVTSTLVMPISIKNGLTIKGIGDRLTQLGFHFTEGHLHGIVNRAVREELIRVAPGQKVGKGRTPRIYAIN